MKKNILSISIVVAISAIGLLISSAHTPNLPHGFVADADAIGGEDDGNARLNYELNMLKDPATGLVPARIRARELAFAATLPNDSHPGSAFGRTTSALPWQQRGPWNVGGRTRAMALDVTNENTIIAGACSGGMWRSTDQGVTWTATTPVNNWQSVTCVAQDTRAGHTNVWYYGTGEADGASATATGAYYLGDGIYKSTDGGVTWNVLASTTTASLTTFDTWGDLVWNIMTNPADTVHDMVYAAAYGGIYRSTDGGTTWALVKGSFGGGDSYYTDIAISKTGIIYASLSSDGGTRGLYRSTDGLTFTNITPATFPTTYNRVKIGISPMNENQVYFLCNTPGFGTPDTNFLGAVEWNSFWRYTYISGDGSGSGGSWSDRSLNLPSTGGLFDKFTCQGSYDLVVKVKPDDTNTVFIGGTNIYRSTTGFADTTHTTFIGGYVQGATLPVVVSYPNHHPDQHEMVFFPSNPNKMLSSNDGGVFITNNNMAPSVSWTSLNNGYMNTMFYTCAIDHALTNDIVIGGAQDNGSWYTNNTTLTSPWVTPRGGDGSFCAIADSGLAYYFSIQNGKMTRAKLNSSGGIDSFARIDPIGGAGYLFVNPYTLDPNNNNIMYLAGGKFLWRNDNLSGIPYAGNWDTISTNWVKWPDSLTVPAAVITAIAVCKTPANRVYYGTSARKVYRLDNANVGTPTATDISSTTSGVPFPSANVSCIAVDPTNGDHVMVVYSNYGVYSLFYSADGGTTWAKVGGNLEANLSGTGDGPSCRWATIIPLSDGNVYLVGTSTGLYATTQLNGTSTTWVQQGTANIGGSVVDMIDYRATDGLVVVATHSHGIFSSHITHVAYINGVKDVFGEKPDFNLTNFPNPFLNQTTIEFNLPVKAMVSLVVFDEAGRLVSTVTNSELQAGENKFVFDRKSLPPGVYYCTLKTGIYTEVRKLMIL